MWEFFGIVIDQLWETVRWFIAGFLTSIAVLILLYKNNLLSKGSSVGFIKKTSYYLFIPLYIGILSWFLSATILVENDAKELARITIEKAEKSIFPEFSKYILSLTDDWLDGKVRSREELVDNYLKNNNYAEGDYSTSMMRWTLNNGLKLVVDQAIKNGEVTIGSQQINFPKLIANYLAGNNGVSKLPFSYLKGMSYSTIRSYTSTFYWIYFFLALIPILILITDIVYTLRKRRKEENRLINPASSLDLNQKKLDSKIEKIDLKKWK